MSQPGTGHPGLAAAMEAVYGPASLAVNAEEPSAGASTDSSITTHDLLADAVGVVNLVTLAHYNPPENAAENAYAAQARQLIKAVHQRILDQPITLSGASDSSSHGKSSPLEGDQDPRSLFLWIFALNRYSVYAQDRQINDLAIQLAKAGSSRFLGTSSASSTIPRLFAKLGVSQSAGTDTSASTAQSLRPFEALSVLTLLQRANGSSSTVLEHEVAEYSKLVDQVLASGGDFLAGADAFNTGIALWAAHFFIHADSTGTEWGRALSRHAFSSLSRLQRSGAFYVTMKAESEDASGDADQAQHQRPDRIAYKDFSTALGIRAYDYSKSSAVWLGIADNIVLQWTGSGGVLEENPPGLEARNLVMLAAALEPGAFKDVFLQ